MNKSKDCVEKDTLENRYKEDWEVRLVNEDRQKDMDSFFNDFWQEANQGESGL